MLAHLNDFFTTTLDEKTAQCHNLRANSICSRKSIKHMDNIPSHILNNSNWLANHSHIEKFLWSKVYTHWQIYGANRKGKMHGFFWKNKSFFLKIELRWLWNFDNGFFKKAFREIKGKCEILSNFQESFAEQLMSKYTKLEGIS